MSVNYYDRLMSIIFILNYLKQEKIPLNKTVVQKIIFLIQELSNINFGYSYILHFYGPYSAELSNDLDYLDFQNIIKIKFDDKIGYDIEVKNEASTYIEKLSDRSRKKNIKSTIKYLLDKCRPINTRSMELLGTVLFFVKKGIEGNELKKTVKVLKPKFSDKEIKEAIEVVNSMNGYHNSSKNN